jgi:hypothetical protein
MITPTFKDGSPIRDYEVTFNPSPDDGYDERSRKRIETLRDKLKRATYDPTIFDSARCSKAIRFSG